MTPTTTERLVVGVAAGVIATVPMTALMLLWHRQLPRRERYALPPRWITVRAADEVGLADDLSEEERIGLTTLAHFGYGGGVGGLYALLPKKSLPGSPLAKGIAYGLAVWSGSYLGWLPAAGLHPPATKEPVRRNALMIGAHIVFGASLGLLTDWLLQSHAGERVSAPYRAEQQRVTNAV